MHYTHIKENERRRIERLHKAGKSKRYIAVVLKRDPKTIRDELRRNSVKKVYGARKAEHKSKEKRKQSKLQCLKVALDKELKEYVVGNIIDDQSPEGVSGRIKHIDKHIQYASTKAIYKFVRSPHGRKIEKHLYSKATKKKSGPKRGSSVNTDGRTMIDERPQHVEYRLEFGHFEGDFIESGKDGEGSLLVLVERKTRYLFIVYITDRTTASINKRIGELLKGVPVQSITLDNDLSFQKHKELSELIEATVFFCHPYTSQEKGTVENRNKAVRRYAKKGCDLSKLTPSFIREIEMTLRNRYMKCLTYRTPQEAWGEEMCTLQKKRYSKRN